MIEIIKVGDVIKTKPVPDRTELIIPEIKEGSAERAARCIQMRGFKAEQEKAARHEEFLDKVANIIGDTMIGIIIFGTMAIALYFGSF